MTARTVTLSTEEWRFKEPLFITDYVLESCGVLLAEISENGAEGRGEAAGVYFLDESAESMLAQAEAVRSDLESGADREALQRLLPAGGARNALDCALWDLEAKSSGKTIWELSEIQCTTTHTFNTVGIDAPDVMANKARQITGSRIKLKLSADMPVERVAAVRMARPDALIGIDVNQGWDLDQLKTYAPQLEELGVVMIEQPLPRGEDTELAAYESSIQLCCDESCLDTSELDATIDRYEIVNIKLDKTGGLTEALNLVRRARANGQQLMVGNMGGTSLAMAPAFVVAQLCDFVDLDGVLFLSHDRRNGMNFADGVVSGLTPALWG